eukprot:m.336221 g.336221  ORF g.336221 m.336221 type:complete len:193 (-) comp17787_c0_seq1:2438-3016(-)
MHIITQMIILYFAGFLASVGVISLHVRYSILSIHKASHMDDQIIVHVICGLYACAMGAIYQFMDNALQIHQESDLASFVRQLTIFIGLVMASAKFEFESNAEMSITLAFIALLVWGIGDRTGAGFAFCVTQAFLLTLVTQVLASYGVLSYKDADLVGVRSWLPSLLFAGCATTGNLGRQLGLIAKHQEKKKW